MPDNQDKAWQTREDKTDHLSHYASFYIAMRETDWRPLPHAFSLHTYIRHQLITIFNAYINTHIHIHVHTNEHTQSNAATAVILPTFPTSAGMLVEFVAKPIPNTRAAGFPTNLATIRSRSLWMSRVPTATKLRWATINTVMVCGALVLFSCYQYKIWMEGSVVF